MEVHETQRYPIRRPEDPEAWLSPDGEVGAWVAELDGDIAGHVCLTSKDGVPTPLMVQRLFVAPAAGGRGIGRMLLDHVTWFAEQHGRPLALEVTNNNHAAISLYVRAGWREAGRRPVRWGGDFASHVLQFSAPSRLR